MIKTWQVWIQAEDGYTWLETAWDDDTTVENHDGWLKAVDNAKTIVAENRGYSMRILEVNVPGVLEAFEIPEVTAETQVVNDE